MTSTLAGVVVHRRAVAAAFALVAALAAPGLLRLEVDNSPRVYLPKDGPQAMTLAAYEARFPGAGIERLIVRGEGLWTAPGLAALERATRWAHDLPDVDAATSLTDLDAVAALRDVDPAAARAAALADPLARGLGWVSADGRAASVVVEHGELDVGAMVALEARLAAIGRGLGPGLESSVVGSRAIEPALDRSSSKVATVYFPILVLFAAALLVLAFRDLGGVLLPLAYVTVCEVVVLGAMGWLGIRLHLVLAVLPPVLFVIALATAVHLSIRCRALEADGLGGDAATLETYRDKGRAVAWTGLSTAVGFGALATSDVAPVRDLGLWAAAGLGVQLVAAFGLLPALLAGTSRRRGDLPERALERRLERFGRRVASAAAAHRSAVLTTGAGLAVLALAGLPRLGAESDVLRSFAPDHPTRRAIESAEAAGLGISTVELELTLPPTGPGLTDPEALGRAVTLGERLRSIDGVVSVAGLPDLLTSVGAASPWAALATPKELRGQALAVLAETSDGRAALARFVTPERHHARWTLFVPTAGYDRVEPIARAAEAAAAELYPRARAAATGRLLGVLAFHRALLSTLGRSLAIGLVLLFGILWMLLGRPADAARALLPNLGPVALLLGGMAWAGMRLDLATVMVASIGLGLAVDDTIHTLAHYRRERRVHGAREAVLSRLERAAPAYLLTGTILAAGFGVCALSDFSPIARFGGLSALVVLLAVTSDLVLVPALFALRIRR